MDNKEIGWRQTVLDLSFSGQGQVAGCCDVGNEHSGSTKKGGREFVDLLRNCQLIKKDYVPWCYSGSYSYNTTEYLFRNCRASRDLTTE